MLFALMCAFQMETVKIYSRKAFSYLLHYDTPVIRHCLALALFFDAS